MITKDIQILTNWFSPNFPTGGFSYSMGFDQLIDSGQVSSAVDLESALRASILGGTLRNDGILLSRTMENDCQDLCHFVQAVSTSAERFEETMAQGISFATAVNKLHNLQIEDMPYPVAVGTAAKAMKMPSELVLPLFLQAQVSNITMICARLLPLGNHDTQSVILKISSLIEVEFENIMRLSLEDISSSCFTLDMASILHETQKVRLCKT